jgi:hypothetical protein
VLLNQTSPAATLAKFTTPVDFAVSSPGITGIALGDLNGDNKLDIATSGYSNVGVFLNQTPTNSISVALAPKLELPTNGNAFGIEIGDVNSDGKPDLAVADSYQNGSVGIYLNTTPAGASTASFAPPVQYASIPATCCVWLSPWHARLADLNGDAKPELLILNSGGALDIRVNTTPSGASTPSFGPQTDFTGGLDAAIGDLNGDGKPDLALGDQPNLRVLLNTTPTGSTTLSFAPPVELEAGPAVFSLVTVDLNGDGKLDIATANEVGSSTSILLNQTPVGAATASFSKPRTYAAGNGPYVVVANDFNSDGLVDLALNPREDYAISVLLKPCK